MRMRVAQLTLVKNGTEEEHLRSRVVSAMSDPAILAQLREQLRAIETGGFRRRPVLPFGIDAVDARLAPGGLRLDALHEVAAGTADMADDCAATLFMAGI